MIRLTQNDWRIFRRLQKKHKVSTEFLCYNLENIEKFIWFETWPRIVIRRYAIRKRNRVFIIYYRLRRVLFDQSNSKMLKRMRQNIKQWSKRIVAWQKKYFGIKEYVEEIIYEDKFKEKQVVNSEDVSKQMKEQLELLKNSRRPQSLIANNLEYKKSSGNEEKQKSDSNNVDDARKNLGEQINNKKTRRNDSTTINTRSELSTVEDKSLTECPDIETQGDWQINLESTPEKQITTRENMQPVKQLDTDEKTEKSPAAPSSQQTEKLKTGLNFLDMLMCKVSGSSASSNSISNANSSSAEREIQRVSASSSSKEHYQYHPEHSMDSTDEFLGFDDCERIPGMLMTPIVPHSTKNSKNSVFVSESLNEYMRLNDLETSYNIDEEKAVAKGKIFARDMEGLMTPKTKPPHFDMPAVPETLLKFRTVADRKQYLQKFSKNSRLAIINNEASIYRELQRRMRTQKVKSASQIVAQSSNSSMSFTRNGWNAASFINTEFNRYYYQVLDIDHGAFKVQLRGARGNNDEFHKTPYVSCVTKPPTECPEYCVDDKIWQYLKPIKTIAEKTKKLNKTPLPPVFKPCPLSHKTLQKPLDDDTAALLLAGGSMAVVRMPTVELEVFPECGKPLHEIAKRYLQYILPHHDISREWAEFSVSTLQEPRTLKEAEQAAAKSFNSQELRKSYTFVIPYLNDRNHILVRRVVDRSEKLDESFQQCIEERELVPKTDFSFRKNLDLSDDVLLTCADVVSDMINTVAISCSENSFIKTDPDGLDIDHKLSKYKRTDHSKQDKGDLASSPNLAAVAGGVLKKQKKQNSLLLELKRLNATIIDAAVKPENDVQPCSNDYCRMGCICVSLKEIVPIREHCGKTKCMLECSCKTSNQSRIMRLETEGRTLTTEDAFMLRRKATARLARMEKEFTSTVVLTENETLLINETNNDKKRRCTKAPKRYEDFTDTEDEQRRNSPKKTALTTIDKEKHLAVEIKEVHEPVYVKDSILEQLKHCTVNLVPLQDMDNIAPWCMVHNLYKCFCKGRAVEGKPVIIEKEEVNTTVEHEADHSLDSDGNVSVKARYTFDKEELMKNVINKGKDDHDEEFYDADPTEDFEEGVQDDKDVDIGWFKERKRKQKENKEVRGEKPTDQSGPLANSEVNVKGINKSELKDTLPRPESQKSKRSLHDVRRRFYLLRQDSCRRHIPTPRRMYLYCNRRRRLNILKSIKESENEQTRLLLNEHVMRSVYYHKIDIENHKKDKFASSSKDKNENVKEKLDAQVSQPPQAATTLPSANVAKGKFLLVNEVVDLLGDEDDNGISTFVNKDKADDTQPLASSSRKSCSPFEKLIPDTEPAESTNHFQICSTAGVITVKKFATLTDLKNTEKIKSPPPTSNTTTVQKDVAGVRETDEKAAVEMERQKETGTGAAAVGELKLPKIASCYSLNLKANVENPSISTMLNEEQPLDFTSVTSVHSAAFSQNQNQQFKNSPNPLSAGTVTSKDKGSSNTLVLDMNNENVRDVYNNVIKQMNSLVSKKMQDIDCALQRESHVIPTPNSDILCIMKWSNFLDGFCEGFAFIWQVKVKEATFFVVTVKNIMPLIMGAMGIVNITALKAEKMPLIGRMLLQKFRNKETEKLAVVMQGKPSHWVLKGFLKSDPTTACNKPTPESHPSLTKKINVLCSLLVKQRQKDDKKKDKSVNQLMSAPVNPTTQTITPTQAPSQSSPVTPKIAQVMPTRRMISMQPCTAPKTQNSTSYIQLQQPVPQLVASQICQPNETDATQKSKRNDIINTGKIIAKLNSRKRKPDNAQSTSSLKMDNYIKMSSNIEFRSVTQSDINEIFLPELHKLDHKWLVLDLHNDFSHIFVPDFRDLVSLDRIQKVINFARQKSKIVKLQFFQNAPFDAFVTPKSIRKIYFGPLTTNMKTPTLILLQSVDGQMMLRELYQLQHNIVKKPEERTKAFWLVHFKGKTHFEMDVNTISGTATDDSPIPLSSTNPSLNVNLAPEPAFRKPNDDETNIDNDEEDEDCVIIDNAVQTCGIKTDTSLNILSQSNSLSAPMSIQCTLASNANKVDTTTSENLAKTILKVPNTNTIIKPLNSTNTSTPVLINVPSLQPASTPVPILTLPPNTIITGINTPPPMTTLAGTSVVNIPKAAVITGIESAPPEAPYSSTIFISPTSSSATLTTMAATLTSATTVGNTTITSHSSKTNRIQANELKTAQSENGIRQALELGGIKRRRISIFCSNKYDKISENLAVDAVIRKILPDNTEDFQINPVGEDSNASLSATEVVTTMSSTQISQIKSSTELNIPQTNLSSSKNITAKPKAPIVFDVNFMDDGDEPTASIVIKPTSKTAENSTTSPAPNHIQTSKSLAPVIKAANTSSIRPPVFSSTLACANTNQTSLTTRATFSEPLNKKAKLPTFFNNANATAASKEKVVNPSSSTNQQANIPTFSAPKPIASKLATALSSNLSKPSTATSARATPFPFSRKPVPVKVKKVVSSTAAATLQTVQPIAITTTAAAAATNPTSPSSSLSMKQVQDLLNKPSRNIAAINPVTTSAAASSTPAMPLQLLPTIKAIITPAIVTAISSATSTAITSASTVPVTSGNLVPSAYTAIKSATTVAPETTSLSPTLTISKVQSFGSPQKPYTPEKIQPTLIQPATQNMASDLSDKVPIPPAHIQYGYIVSVAYPNQKFVAKRVAEEFYIKVPSVGILKLQGLGAVNNYLNKYISKMSKDTQTAVWQFVAASKTVQMQNHQKSLLVRKTKNTNENAGTPKNVAINPNASLEEPILIDD